MQGLQLAQKAITERLINTDLLPQRSWQLTTVRDERERCFASFRKWKEIIWCSTAKILFWDKKRPFNSIAFSFCLDAEGASLPPYQTLGNETTLCFIASLEL